MTLLGRILVVAGALLALASAYLHGFLARPVVLGRLPGDVAAATREGINAAWVLGTAAMFAFAIQAVLSVRSLGRDPGAWRAPVVGGLFFLGYGAWGYVYRHGHPHFLGFMAIGVLWIAGSLLARPPREPH